MKIEIKGEVIETRIPKNHLRFSDLQPNDVFRFARGAERNIYLMGHHGEHLHITGAREYYDAHDDTPVILYPNATLNLGDEVRLRGEVEDDA